MLKLNGSQVMRSAHAAVHIKEHQNDQQFSDLLWLLALDHVSDSLASDITVSGWAVSETGGQRKKRRTARTEEA